MPLKSAIIILFIMAYTAQSALCATSFVLRAVRGPERQEDDTGSGGFALENFYELDTEWAKKAPNHILRKYGVFVDGARDEGLWCFEEGRLPEADDIKKIFALWNEGQRETMQRHESRGEGERPVIVIFDELFAADVHEYVLHQASNAGDKWGMVMLANIHFSRLLIQALAHEHNLRSDLQNIKEGLAKFAKVLDFNMALIDEIEFVFGNPPEELSPYETSHSLQAHPTRDTPRFYIRLIDSISGQDPFNKGVIAREIGHLVACSKAPFRFRPEELNQRISDHPYIQGIDFNFNRDKWVYEEVGGPRAASAAHHLNELIALYCSMLMVSPKEFTECVELMAQRYLKRYETDGFLDEPEVASVYAFSLVWAEYMQNTPLFLELIHKARGEPGVAERSPAVNDLEYLEALIRDYSDCLSALRFVTGEERDIWTPMVQDMPYIYPSNPHDADKAVGRWRHATGRTTELLKGGFMHIWEQHMDIPDNFKVINGRFPKSFMKDYPPRSSRSPVELMTVEDCLRKKRIVLCVAELATDGRSYSDMIPEWDDEFFIRILPEESFAAEKGVKVLGGFIRSQPDKDADRVMSVFPMFGSKVTVKKAREEVRKPDLDFLPLFRDVRNTRGDRTFMRWGSTKDDPAWGMKALINCPQWLEFTRNHPNILHEDLLVLTYYAICFGKKMRKQNPDGKRQATYQIDVSSFAGQAPDLIKRFISRQCPEDSIEEIAGNVKRFYRNLRDKEGVKTVTLRLSDDFKDILGIDFEFVEDATPLSKRGNAVGRQQMQLQRHP